MTEQKNTEVKHQRHSASNGGVVQGRQRVTRVIDGFQRAPGATHRRAALAAQKQPSAATPIHSTPKKQAVHTAATPAAPAKHAPHQGPQRSRTLLRRAVKKPHKTIHAVQTAPGTQRGIIGQVISPADQKRLERARRIEQSNLVRRFAESKVAAPVLASAMSHIRPATAVTAVATPVQAPADDIDDDISAIIEESLEKTKVQSHEEARRGLRKGLWQRLKLRSRGTVAAVALAVGFLVTGFVAYHQTPSIAMRVAANRAGFPATLPQWHPNGFDFAGPIDYSKGQVTISYKSNQKTFKLSQQVSDWTSESLAANYLEDITEQYQTYRDKGLTVYIYDGSNATWVDKGVWYTITGDSELSSEEIINVASSL